MVWAERWPSGHALLDGTLITVIPDPAIQLANLRAGKIDSMVISKPLYNKIKDDPEFRVYVNPHNTMVGLNFNHKSKSISDIRVRKAISHALDRKALIHGIQFDLARIASCMFPDNHWCHNPSLVPVSYDPELSKRLLAEAGYSDGLTIKGYNFSDPDSRTFAVAIKDMLSRVGIEWKVNSLSLTAFGEKARNLEYDVSQHVWPYIEEPDLPLTSQFHPNGAFNFGRSHNEKVIPLIEKGRSELDGAKRAKIYQEIERLLYENYEDVWLWWEVMVVAFQKNVHGYNHEMRQKHGQLYQWSHPLWFKDGHP